MKFFAIVFVLLLPMATSDLDPNISNGTCWFSGEKQSDDAYIPCGNDGLGDQACCQARDVCLSNNACYNAQYGVTYLAGCTDSTYTNTTVCPFKGDLSTQQWVGLVRCFVSNDTNKRLEEWAPCEDTDQPTLNTPDTCSCNTDSDTAVFTAGPTLTNIASLPVKQGNDIAWYPGFAPATVSSSPTKTSSLHTTSSILNPSLTPTVGEQTSSTSNPSPTTTETSSPLATSTKIGIGVGVAAGTILIAAFLIILALRYRHKRFKQQTPLAIDQIRHRSLTGPAIYENKRSEEDELKSPAWSGHKSELPADESGMARMNTTNTLSTLSTTNAATSSVLARPEQYQPSNIGNHASRYQPYSRQAVQSFISETNFATTKDGPQYSVPAQVQVKAPNGRAVYEMEG